MQPVVGGGGVGVGVGVVGGSQLPLTQVPPPRLTNGSGVVQPLGVGVGVTLGGGGAGVGVGAGVVGGSQLPLTQVPPPSDTNGFGGMVQPVGVGVGVGVGAGATGVGVGAGAGAGPAHRLHPWWVGAWSAEPVAVDAGAAAQAHERIGRRAARVRHGHAGRQPVAFDTGAAAERDERIGDRASAGVPAVARPFPAFPGFGFGVFVSPSLGGVIGVVGAGIETPGGVMPGGYQLPFEHVPPPSETNGSGTVHVLSPVVVAAWAWASAWASAWAGASRAPGRAAAKAATRPGK